MGYDRDTHSRGIVLEGWRWRGDGGGGERGREKEGRNKGLPAEIGSNKRREP